MINTIYSHIICSYYAQHKGTGFKVLVKEFITLMPFHAFYQILPFTFATPILFDHPLLLFSPFASLARTTWEIFVEFNIYF